MSNFLNNTTDLEKIYNEVDGIDDVMIEQDNLIAQIIATLEEKKSTPTTSLETITGTVTTTESYSITIPELIGKNNFILIPMDGTLTVNTVMTGMATYYILSIVHMNGNTLLIMQQNKAIDNSNTTDVSFDNVTGTISLTNEYLEVFYTNTEITYYFIGW